MTILLTALMVAIGGAARRGSSLYVALKGVKALNWGFLTDTPPGNPSDAGGGFYNGIIGSFEIVGLATLVALPLGIGCAIYLNQYATGRVAAVLRLVVDVMLGIPTIVTGAFVYAIWVVEFGFSGFAGALALALVMVPLIVRATEEMLRLVPRDIREASLALGVTQSRTIVSVLLPRRAPGIITGVDARGRPRDGRDRAAAPDRARQRPLRRDQPRPAHVDALAADLRQRDGRLRRTRRTAPGPVRSTLDRHRPAPDHHRPGSIARSSAVGR